MKEAKRCLGLIGGLGVGAAVHYYVNLAKAHHAQDRVMDLVMAHAEPPLLMEFIRAGDREGMARHLNGFVERMKAAGAEFAVIPAVTPHYCIHELVAISPLRLMNIFDPLNGELATRKLKRAAVFGTRFVIESDLYGEVKGVELVRPQADEIELVHNIYTKLALSGEASAEQHRRLTELAQKLIERERLEAIILAGTDLSLLFNASNTDFPCIDCAELHIRAIAEEMLR